MQVKVLGQILGEASDWDSYDDGYQVYDFKSSVAAMPDGSCVAFELFSGDVSYYGEDGEVLFKMHLLDVLKTL
jgi:hypothetical protein